MKNKKSKKELKEQYITEIASIQDEELLKWLADYATNFYIRQQQLKSEKVLLPKSFIEPAPDREEAIKRLQFIDLRILKWMADYAKTIGQYKVANKRLACKLLRLKAAIDNIAEPEESEEESKKEKNVITSPEINFSNEYQNHYYVPVSSLIGFNKEDGTKDYPFGIKGYFINISDKLPLCKLPENTKYLIIVEPSYDNILMDYSNIEEKIQNIYSVFKKNKEDIDFIKMEFYNELNEPLKLKSAQQNFLQFTRTLAEQMNIAWQKLLIKLGYYGVRDTEGIFEPDFNDVIVLFGPKAIKKESYMSLS